MPGKKILLVEDQESLLKLESILLTSRGFEVRGVSDGQAALAAIEEDIPDLMLLDIMLPDLDGFEICRMIKEKERTRKIPIIMVTARKSRMDVQLSKEAGADAYITKPFKSAMLIETIQKILAR
ncbi:response regulator transcription factor [Desulfuromonas sp. TF]|jgi:twitching motility two-component system response regulator PilG|uniref:response regulator transcription factor n=1 Tax=Desulfuromonas sp. TF TaxID=1232410 RepID=UPI000426E1F1|nr:response regulator [Desulfuromonas sp. TF]